MAHAARLISPRCFCSSSLHRRQPERQERRKRGHKLDPVGYDAGKKIKGKKRHVGVGTLGLMHALLVLPANYQDRDVIALLLRKATARVPSLRRALADGGYQGEATTKAVMAEAGRGRAC